MTRKPNWKVYVCKEDIIIFFSLFFCFPLLGLKIIMPNLKYIYFIISLLFFVLMTFLLIRLKMALRIFLPLLLYLFAMANTIIQHGDVIQASSSLVSDLCPFFLVVTCISMGKRKELIVNADGMFTIFMVVNAAHMILTENGFGLTRANNNIFILGTDNSLMFFIIVSVVVHELRKQICPVSLLREIPYQVMIWYELIRGEAATAIIVYSVMFLCLILARKIQINRYFYTGCGLVAFLNVFLLFIRKMAFMEPIFASLGKDITMSTRTILWDKVIPVVESSFLFGYGISDNMWYIHHGKYLMEAHNMVLSYMLQGGIVLLVLFLLMVLTLGWKIRNSNSLTSRYLAVGIIAYLLVFLVESPSSVPGFYFLLALCQMEDYKFEQ